MRADLERQKPARARAGQIRSGITNYIHTLGVIAQAYQERDWETLGYESWQQYIDGEFPAARLGIPAEYREKAMVDLRLAGLSTRAIAPVVGVHHSTVARQVSQDATPEPIQGVDGKTYSPARSPLVEAMTGAIEDAQKRAEDHRVGNHGEAAGVGAPPAAGAGVPAPAPATDPGVAAPAPDVKQATTPSGTAPEGGTSSPSSGAPPSSSRPELSGEEAGGGAANPPPAPNSPGADPAPAPEEPPAEPAPAGGSSFACPACLRPLEP